MGHGKTFMKKYFTNKKIVFNDTFHYVCDKIQSFELISIIVKVCT